MNNNDSAHDGQYVQKVEEELLNRILDDVQKDTLTFEKAQQQAKDFLALLPIVDKEDLLAKLQDLGQKYTEAQAVYVHYAIPHDAEKRHKKIQAMAVHIKQGNIEQALKVAKGELYANGST